MPSKRTGDAAHESSARVPAVHDSRRTFRQQPADLTSREVGGDAA